MTIDEVNFDWPTYLLGTRHEQQAHVDIDHIEVVVRIIDICLLTVVCHGFRLG
jgi:hypothetical protein